MKTKTKHLQRKKMRPSDSVSSKSGGCAARPLERLASALLAAAALSAPCADALAEDVASNAFVVVRADGVRSAGETGFHTPCSSGAGIEVEPREGWKLGGNSSVGDDPGRKFISVVSSLNEDSQQIWFDVCSFSYSMETNHAPVPAIRAVTQPKQIALYAVPEGNVRVSAAASVEIVSNGVHDVVRRWHACEGCGGPHDPREELVFSEESPLKYFDWTSSGPGCTTNSNTWTGMLTKGLEQNLSFNVVASNDCRECTCGASTNAVVDVYELSEERDDYLGLDRTDYGRTNTVVKTARAILDPGAAGETTYDWKDCGICAFTGRTDLATADYFAPDVDSASESFLAEKLTVTAGVTEDGVDASATCTTNFTVVKVDVEIDGMGEEFEETAGVYVQQVPDTDTERWRTEWTNSLKDVTITCKPDDGPIADQWVTLEFPDESLWVRSSKGGYEKAKKRYRVKDLNRTHFKLHGHERSAKFKGDSIVAKHEVSKAVDKALFTVFRRPWLVPDYDRKNGIDDNDVAKAKEGETVFRFWINDDDDRQAEKWYQLELFGSGDIMQDGLHLPSQGGGNCANLKVDGRCDLVDFTPILVDISEVFPGDTPSEFLEKLIWEFESDCLNVVWTDLEPYNASSFHTQNVLHCGEGLKSKSFEAEVESIGLNREFDEDFENLLLNKRRLAVLVEGCAKGTKFNVKCRHINGLELARGYANVSSSPVDDMIRWMNLRYIENSADRSKQSNFLSEPKNRPDCECEALDARHFVFVHGYNINSDEALGWSCECFKRLWQSGYNGKFTGVDWYGSQSQIFLPVSGKNLSPKYWPNVEHAFKSAREFRRNCDKLTGSIHLIAHSLGNVLVSAAIADTNWKDYAKYYMLNAAVAQQAFCESELRDPEMIDFDWENVPSEYMSAHWYKCAKFSNPNDFRKKLNWIGRFINVQNKESFYSNEENVVSSEAFFPVWKMQEREKGTLWGSEAGWGVNDRYASLVQIDKFDLKKALPYMTEDAMVTEPLFEPFKSYSQKMHSLEPYLIETEGEEDNLRAYFLARAIPATSSSVGGGAPHPQTGITGTRYEQYEGGDWPRGDKAWDHSDFICVAYYHLKPFYDALETRK